MGLIALRPLRIWMIVVTPDVGDLERRILQPAFLTLPVKQRGFRQPPIGPRGLRFFISPLPQSPPPPD